MRALSRAHVVAFVSAWLIQSTFGSIEYFTNAADEVLFAHPRVPDSISEEAVDALFDWAERANLVGKLPGGGKVSTPRRRIGAFSWILTI